MEKPSPLRRLRRALWFATAGLVILAAVLLTLTRLLLPELEGQRNKVEALASAALGQPVHIRTLSSRLHGIAPVVVLEDVELLDVSGEQTVARFREVEVGFAPLASLRRLRPVTTTLTVLGADLTLVRQVDGRLQVQGVAGADAQGEADTAATEGIGRWVMEQGRLAFLDSRVHFRDLKTGRSVDFERVDVELLNTDARHQLNVEVTLPAGMGRKLHLALDLEGDVLSPGAWHGRGYLRADGVRPAPWLEEWGPLAGYSLQQGVLDVQLWGKWEAGRLVRADAAAEARELSIHAQQDQLALARLGTAARWQRQEQGWELRLGDVRLQRKAADATEPMQVWLRRDSDGWDLQLSTLRLEDLSLLAPLLPDAGQRAVLAAMQPQGWVRQLRLTLAGGTVTHAQGILEQAALEPWQQLPGFSGLSGRWVWGAGHGQVLVDSRNATLTLPRLFRAPLSLRQVQGGIGIRHGASGWRIDLDGLRVATPDIQAAVDATFALPADDAPYLDLRGMFWNGRAMATPRYLPAGIMGHEALAWLDQAFHGGSVTSGGVLFHGPLPAFPFDGGEGRFEVDFGVHDAELFFQAGWPALRQVDARVRFLNRGMVIDAESGRMYDSAISRAQVGIADLHHPLLTVQGAARLTGDDAIRLLRDTPLRTWLGDYVAALRLEGDSELELDFALPLDSALAESQPFRLQGAVTLQDNRLWLAEVLSVDAIDGRLAFTERSLQAEVLRARLLDEPASFNIRTAGRGTDAYTVIAGRGQMQAAALRRLHDAPLLGRISGRGAWQGSLRIPHGKQRSGAQLRLHSDLQGMALDLPHPLHKAAEDARALDVVHHFSGTRRGQLQVSYGEDLRVLLALDEHGALQRGALHFGTEVPVLPDAAALQVSGSLRELALDRWATVLRGDKGAAPTLPPVRLDMAELHLAAAAQEGDGGKADWRDLPPLDVRIGRFGYGTLQLEQLAFQLRSSRDSAQLSDLHLTGPGMVLSGQGRWQSRPRSYSEMKLNLDSSDVGQMLRHLKVASVISRGTAQVGADLSWPAPLEEFGLATLGGTVHARLEDGLMDEVDPGAGRLLGLLSLQALPRRLILDFRDLFQKGLAFSRIEGDIALRGGDAHTSNLVMESSAAVIRVEGRTGLVARDYDQRITVVPNLSGTAPVVGALAFGPQVGAVMLLFQRLLKKNVDEAARTEYRITGSWDQPVIEKIAQPKGEAASALEGSAL